MAQYKKKTPKKIDLLRNRLWEEPEFRTFLDGDTPLIQLFDLQPKGRKNMSEERKSQYRNYYSSIGNTPLVNIEFPHTRSTIYVKLEYKNPRGGSHYSRYWAIYLYMAEMFGFIEPGKTKMLETTSGSSGIALAEVCQVFNYPLTMVVPQSLPKTRIAPMEEFGAKIIRKGRYLKGCIEELKHLIRSNQGYFCPDHSRETSDLIVHVFKRIFAEANDQIENVDYTVLGFGNGSSVRAAVDYFYKEENYMAHVVAFEPDYTRPPYSYTFGLRPPGVDMPHIQYAERSLSDLQIIQEADKEAIKENLIFKQEPQFEKLIKEFGESSLYALHFATEIAENEENQNILILAYDQINRY